MTAFIMARLAEPSTWRGIVYIATAAGARMSPELQDAIITAGLALAGLISVSTRG